MRDFTLPVVNTLPRVLPGASVAKFVPFWPSVSWRSKALESMIRNGVPDWNVVKPRIDQPCASLLKPWLATPAHLAKGSSY